MNTGIGYFFGTALIMATEADYIREHRHVNIIISALLQYSYLVAGIFFLLECVAVFRYVINFFGCRIVKLELHIIQLKYEIT